ncbi:hypothetical protein QBC40DRAFT_100933 [Triangularia verruculosa]|uniref:SHSP domain-containing protein n=1 Tax=Triangularia verruculosa TaxID=2587418 RepID=A0AAN6XHB9_9PEZI|nr:hypothetical protein QBC40DRAFT_100933 [Triangularia verruculosa]
MSFNWPEDQGQGRRPPPGHRPPPPPPGYGPEGFWNFIRAMTPNTAGNGNGNGPTSPPNNRPDTEGVDTQPPFPPFGFFGGGGPEGFNFNPSWSMPHHPPPPHHRGPAGSPGDGTGDDSEGHPRHHHGRHGRGGHHSNHSRTRSHSPPRRREPEVEEDLYDISAAAGEAELDLMEAYHRARENDHKDDDMKSTSTLRDGINTPTTTTTFEDEKEKDIPDPPEEIPSASPGQHGRRGRCRGGPGRRGRWGRGPGGGFGRHNSWGWGSGPNTFGFEFGRPPFPPHFGPGGGFGGPRHASGFGGPSPIDIGAAVRGLGSLGWAMGQHPLARGLRDYLSGGGNNQQDNRGEHDNRGEEGVVFEGEQTFSPPADVFDSEGAWTVHLAVPGAKKQDVGVHWDKDRGVLVVRGVVYRPGDEEFLRGLVTAERKVGLFERKIKMPPVEREEADEEVDEDGITAKLEDGVLVVAVPKRRKEKGTGEIKRVQVL